MLLALSIARTKLLNPSSFIFALTFESRAGGMQMSIQRKNTHTSSIEIDRRPGGTSCLFVTNESTTIGALAWMCEARSTAPPM
jgi:hypothetical protein